MASDRVGPLFTDLYELTMAAGYFAHQITQRATFSLFVRGNARGRRGYYVAAGLESIIGELSQFGFQPDEIAYLKDTGLFSNDFLDFLAELRFTGELSAMPEGTLFFPDEPILEVTAPIIEAQLLETYLLNAVGFPSLMATKAARCMHAAGGRPLIDFSLRRTQGVDAGDQVARSCWIAGFSATSNVLAGKRYGIPISGTMAHSYVTAFDREIDAFRSYAQVFADSAVFLIDTYDTIQGAHQAAAVGLEMQRAGHRLVGVRIDSGDMVAQSGQVRQILDTAGLNYVKIFASSGFDEYKIAKTLAAGARIDAFGVGTMMGVSADVPFLNVVYKMVRFGNRNVRKFSPGKITLAGRKQVFRRHGTRNDFIEDTIGTRDELREKETMLLETVMENGRPVGTRPMLEDIRRRFRDQFSRLDDRFKAIEAPEIYPVGISARLEQTQKAVSVMAPELSPYCHPAAWRPERRLP